MTSSSSPGYADLKVSVGTLWAACWLAAPGWCSTSPRNTRSRSGSSRCCRSRTRSSPGCWTAAGSWCRNLWWTLWNSCLSFAIPFGFAISFRCWSRCFGSGRVGLSLAFPWPCALSRWLGPSQLACLGCFNLKHSRSLAAHFTDGPCFDQLVEFLW